MAFNLTGNLLGGPIAADLLKSMQSAINTTANPTLLQVYPTLLVLSAHYNTQLGLLAALDIEFTPGAEDIAWRTRIPNLAAVLAFELHKVGGVGGVGLPPSYYVRAVFQDGPGEGYRTLPLACSNRKDGSVAAQVVGTCFFSIQHVPCFHCLHGHNRARGVHVGRVSSTAAVGGDSHGAPVVCCLQQQQHDGLPVGCTPTREYLINRRR